MMVSDLAVGRRAQAVHRCYLPSARGPLVLPGVARSRIRSRSLLTALSVSSAVSAYPADFRTMGLNSKQIRKHNRGRVCHGHWIVGGHHSFLDEHVRDAH